MPGRNFLTWTLNSRVRRILTLLSAAALSSSFSLVQAQVPFMERNLDRNLADERLLRNIEPVLSATPKLLRLRPVRFQVQSPVSGQLLGPLRLGFVAQALHRIYPGMVLRDFDARGTLRVEYGQLIPVLTRGFQESEARLSQLEAQLAAMNRELVELRGENSRLAVGLATLNAGNTPAGTATSNGGGRNGGENPAQTALMAAQIAELQRAVRQLQTTIAPFLAR